MSDCSAASQHYEHCSSELCKIGLNLSHLSSLSANTDDLVVTANQLLQKLKQSSCVKNNPCLSAIAVLCQDLLLDDTAVGCVKLAKTIVEILQKLEKAHCQEVKCVISTLFLNVKQQLATYDALNTSNAKSKLFNCLRLVSTLYDLMPAARCTWQSDALLVQIHLCKLVDAEIQGSSLLNQSQQLNIHIIVKLMLQTCQCLVNGGLLENVFWDEKLIVDHNEKFMNAGAPDGRHCVMFMLHVSLKLLHLENLPHDSSLIVGALTGLLLTLIRCPAVTVNCFQCVLLKLSTDQRYAFGRLCVLHGFLSYADFNVLFHKCNDVDTVSGADGVGSSCILFEIYPSVVNLCLLIDLKYHAFRLLELWFRKMRSFCELNHQSTGEEVKSMTEADSTPYDSSTAAVVRSEVPGTTGYCCCRVSLSTSVRLVREANLSCCEQDTVAAHMEGVQVPVKVHSCYCCMNSVLCTPSSVKKHWDVIQNRTAGLLVGHADCNLDSISESVMAVLDILFQIDSVFSRDVCTGKHEYLASSMLTSTLAMPWRSKSKYTLLNAILRHVPYQQVLDRCQLIMNDLLHCLSTNVLTPPSCLVYNGLLQIFCSKTDSLHLWWTHCWPTIHLALTSNDRLSSLNAVQQWLPSTTRMLPTAVPLMMDYFKDNCHSDNDWRAVVVLLGIARSADVDVPAQLVTDQLKMAICSGDSDLRLSCFSLICMSRRTTDALSDDEVLILKEFLPQNLSSDEAPFRKQLLTCVLNAVTRMRDASLLELRSKTKPKQDVVTSRASDFIDWLWEMCLDNIEPGANYQRTYSCLSIVRLILDCFELRPHQKFQRKGGIPADVSLFLDKARQSNRCNFFSCKASYCLVCCMFNSTDEIRQLAADVLILYFPWPLPTSSPHLVPINFLSTGLRLCNSAKSDLCDTGGIIIAMVYRRSVIGDSNSFNVSGKCVNRCYEWTAEQSASVLDDASCHFLSQLVDLIEVGIQLASDDTLHAASSYPLHGFLLAFNRCLRYGLSKNYSPLLWKPVISRLKSLILRLIDFVLDVYGGKLQKNDTAPSFEQMHQAIEELVQNCDENESVHLTYSCQLVNAWCWLNIRESCLLLGQMTKTFVGMSSDAVQLIDVNDAYEMGEAFVKILTHCRHRGAIEACCAGFNMYCCPLLNSGVTGLRDIPRRLLETVLSHVESRRLESSITRRSAGLPLVVQSLLSSEATTKQGELLDMLMSRLLELLSQPVVVTDETDVSCDISQVHAINILRAVVHESCLAFAVSRYYAKLVVHALDGFLSPLWTIRNASLQLFGSLVPKLMGEKKTHGDDYHTTPSSSFFMQYSDFGRHIESVLGEAVQRLRKTPNCLTDVNIFPILSILSRLSPGLEVDSDLEKMTVALCCHVKELSRSPVYAVRCMTSRALIGLVTVSQSDSLIDSLVDSLPESDRNVCYNELHGKLLQIEQLLTYFKAMDKDWCAKRFRQICRQLVDFGSGNLHFLLIFARNVDCEYNSALPSALLLTCSTRLNALARFHRSNWILSSCCYMVRAVYVKILMLFHMELGGVDCSISTNSSVIRCPDDVGKDSQGSSNTWALLADEVQQILVTTPSRGQNLQSAKVGYCLWVENLVKYYLVTADKDHVGVCVDKCLSSRNHDVVRSALKWLSDPEAVHCLSAAFIPSVQITLHDLIADEGLPYDVLVDATSSLYSFYELCSAVTPQSIDAIKFFERLLNFVDTQPRSNLASIALKLSAMLMKDRLESGSMQRIAVEKWLELAYRQCEYVMPEDVRVNSVKSLCTVACCIVQQALEHQSSDREWNDTVLVMFKLLYSLLSDVQSDVRDVACATISSILPQDETHSVSSTSSVLYSHVSKLFLGYSTVTWCQLNDSCLPGFYGWLSADVRTEQLFLSCDYSSTATQLFESEDLNPFLETSFQSREIYTYLKRLVMRPSLVAWLNGEMNHVSSLLEQITRRLHEIRPQDILVTCTTKRFCEIVQRLLLQSSLLLKWSSDIDIASDNSGLDARMRQFLAVPCVSSTPWLCLNITVPCNN